MGGAEHGTGVLKDINIKQTPQMQPADEMPIGRRAGLTKTTT
jgi:hypothetical protein